MTGPEDGEEVSVETFVGAGKTGQLLGEARAAAGLELTDIARETKVPLRHLRAIEDDNHVALPALPYSIGFVKSFARSVGLDPETVARQFRSETSQTPHVPSVAAIEPLDERRMPSRGLVLTSVAAVLLIVGGLSAWGSGLFDAPPPAAPVAAVAAPPVAAPVVPTDQAIVPGDATGTPPADPNAIAPASAAGVAPNTATPAPAVAAGGAVVLTAKEDVWVKIYDRTTRTSAKVGILKTGETFTVPADQPGLLLWTGKAGAVAVTVGGRAIPPLGGPVQTVRDVSLAPADLLARAAAPAVPAGAPQ